jgi:hypothetical protein
LWVNNSDDRERLKRVTSELIKGIKRMRAIMNRMRGMGTFMGNDRRHRVHALSQVDNIPEV